MNIVQMIAVLGGVSRLTNATLRPDSNDAAGLNFSPVGESELWECVNDVTPDEDATYITTSSNLVGVRFGLTNPTRSLASGLEHKIVVRAKRIASATSHYYNLAFMQGDFLVLQGWSDIVLTTSYVDYEAVLSAQAISFITDYDDIKINIAHYVSADAQPLYEGRFTQVYLQIGG